MEQIREQLLDAALPHVVFDGWSPQSFAAAIRDSGVAPELARQTCPRGAIDLAVAYHRRGDARMLDLATQRDMSQMRYSQRVAEYVWLRTRVVDREIVRRGMALFSNPLHAAEGAALVCGTADAIWNALGDTSDDLNWYSKRAILSGVLGSTFLYWLGDTSEGDAATREFIDRRIEDVMRFEKFKARMRDTPSLKPLARLQESIAARVRAPRSGHVPGYPGWQQGSDR